MDIVLRSNICMIKYSCHFREKTVQVLKSGHWICEIASYLFQLNKKELNEENVRCCAQFVASILDIISLIF